MLAPGYAKEYSSPFLPYQLVSIVYVAVTPGTQDQDTFCERDDEEL